MEPKRMSLWGLTLFTLTLPDPGDFSKGQTFETLLLAEQLPFGEGFLLFNFFVNLLYFSKKCFPVVYPADD
jgi:hypothetical protein